MTPFIRLPLLLNVWLIIWAALLPEATAQDCRVGWARAGAGGRSLALVNGLRIATGDSTVAFDAHGNPKWQLPLPGDFVWTQPDSGAIFVTGTLRASLTVGTVQLNVSGRDAAFIVRLDTLGNPIWGHTLSSGAPGVGGQRGRAIAGDAQYIYWGGAVEDTIVWGANSYPDLGGADAYVARLGWDGQPDTLLRLGATGRDRVEALAIGPDGQLFIGGQFTDSLQYQQTTLRALGVNTPAVTGTYPDAFVLCLYNLDSVLWARNIGSLGRTQDTPDERVTSLLPLFDGSVYVAGQLHPVAQMGNNVQLSGGGLTQGFFFVAYYDSIGELVWARHNLAASLGGGASYATALAAADSLGVWVAVNTESPLLLNPGSDTLANRAIDAFAIRYDSAGQMREYIHVSGPSDEYVFGLATERDSNRNVLPGLVVTGIYNDTVALGARALAPVRSFNSAFLGQFGHDGQLLEWALPDTIIEPCGAQFSFPLQLIADSVEVSWNTSLSLNFLNIHNPTALALAQASNSSQRVSITYRGCTLLDSLWFVALPASFALSFAATPDTLDPLDPTDPIQFQNLTPDSTRYRFVWNFGDGQTSTAISPSHTFARADTFTIKLWAEDLLTGCVDSLVVPNAVRPGQSPSSRMDAAAPFRYRLYPNPAHDYVMLGVDGLHESATVRIVSALGQEVMKEIVVSGPGPFRMDTSGLPGGVYHVQVFSTEAMPQVLKLIVK